MPPMMGDQEEDIKMEASSLEPSTPMNGSTAASFQDVPNDLLAHMVNQFLNPSERSKVACCNQALRALFPKLLRIQIASAHGDGNHALEPGFYVSPLHPPHQATALLHNQSLQYGVPYSLWTFDYQRSNKVYLGRHTRHADHHAAAVENNNNGRRTIPATQCFTLGLLPKQAPSSQQHHWIIKGGERKRIMRDPVKGDDKVHLILIQQGDSSKARQPNSSTTTHPGYLSYRRHSRESMLWTIDDTTQAAPLLEDAMSFCGECPQQFQLQTFFPSCTSSTNFNNPNNPFQIKHKVLIYAVPEVCDEGEYLLYAPHAEKEGVIGSQRSHVVVDFFFAIENGKMIFQSAALPFSLAIPILLTDRPYGQQASSTSTSLAPLRNLLSVQSARWGCIVYYMAVAADVSDGRSLDLTRFCNKVTDHPNHRVVFTNSTTSSARRKQGQSEKECYIEVKGKELDQEASSIPVNPNDPPWKFLLSW